MGRDFSSFDGISRASPLGVTAQATVSLRQSRYKNAVWVGDRLANTIDLYNNDTGRGVFGQTFNGYEKTRYKKDVGVGSAASASFVVSGGGGAHAPISVVEIAAIATGRVAVCN